MVQENFNNPPAYMGFVGFVRLTGQNRIINGNTTVDSVNHGDYIIRATSASINLKQEQSKPNVIDSRYDKTIYQLGPKVVDGSFDFPAIYDKSTPDAVASTPSIVEILYRYAATRDLNGSLSDFDLEVKYATSLAPNQAEFVYKNCIANTWKFSVTQQDVVNCSIGVIGIDREPAGTMTAPARKDDGACTPLGDTSNGEIGTSRIVTWADARVELGGGRLEESFTGDTKYIGGQYIRSFEVNINNDAERFYTLNKFLFAQAIAARKRDIDGTLEILGRHTNLSSIAETNQNSCFETSHIKFGYVTSGTDSSCTNTDAFNVTIPNVIYEIEELSLTNDLFVTTVNWHSLPAAGTGVCDPMLSSLGTTIFSY